MARLAAVIMPSRWVVRVRWRDFSALFMADADAAVDDRLVAQGVGPCDVIKAAHHGSRTGTSPALLAAVRPKAAIVSCGHNNRYGHPHPEVIDHLRASGVSVFRTDNDGAVLVESRGSGFSVRSAAAGRQ